MQLNDQAIKTLKENLSQISEDFCDEIERKPSSKEFFEILTESMKGLSNGVFSDVNPNLIISIKPEKDREAKIFDSWKKQEYKESMVSDLNDNVFEITSDMLVELISSIEPKPKLEEVCKIILETLHECNDDLLADISPKSILNIKINARKRKQRTLAIGDLVSIPIDENRFAIALAITKNRFGTAYGIFNYLGKIPTEIFSIKNHPGICKYPLYSSDRFVGKGRWKIIGHDDNLLSLFPAEPEIFHKREDFDFKGGEGEMNEIGPYGSGETGSGKLRDLTEEEAREVFTEDYRNVRQPENVEMYLNESFDKLPKS